MQTPAGPWQPLVRLVKIQKGRLTRLSSQQIYDCSDINLLLQGIRLGGPQRRCCPITRKPAGRDQKCRRELLKKTAASIHVKRELGGGSAGGRS